jgi:hypothetical protein
MKYILFLDETGDHGLVNYRPDFPLFLLCGIITTAPGYEIIRQEINKIKEELWNDKRVFLHSRDIRKCEKEFKIFFDVELKKRFYQLINSAVRNLPYSIIASAINKKAFIDKFEKPNIDIYEVAFPLLIEQVVLALQRMPAKNELLIVIEKRSRNEDRQLADHFERLCLQGTNRFRATDLQKVFPTLTFKNKKDNINGLQLADLVAYPIAKYLIDPKKANPAFDVLKNKIYKSGSTLEGLIVFP